MFLPLAPSHAHSPASAQPKKSWLWPGIIPALLLLQGGMCALTAYLAFSDKTFATEPDYYRKSMTWDADAAARRADAALGWTILVDVASSEDAAGDRVVRVLLRDKAGSQINGARVMAEAFAHARASERVELRFVGTEAAGSYEAKMHAARPGIWEFRLTIEVSGGRHAVTKLVDVGASSVRP